MKKIFSAAVCLLLIFFMCAWGEKKVELLDDGKLIDLGKAIEFARPGGESDDETKDDGSDTPAEQAPAESGEKVIVISIQDRVITYNGRIPDNAEDLEKMLIRDSGENVRFSLADDWAEAHVYKRVVKVLEKLHSETGLEYSYE